MITLSELLKFEIVEDEVDNWFLMTSWVPITSIVAGYLVFVLYVGPKWMANRKPFDIKYILLVYNLAQTLINLYYSISTFMRASYEYFLVKVLDLLDTVFFVLKKKWGTDAVPGRYQLFRSRGNVQLLLPLRVRAQSSEISLVEELHHNASNNSIHPCPPAACGSDSVGL
ncbi:hypothetical protein M8J76_015753 [Diaphorina citri]|nr:hypothetical protein M8J76_015753 [Diaphorina citri]